MPIQLVQKVFNYFLFKMTIHDSTIAYKYTQSESKLNPKLISLRRIEYSLLLYFSSFSTLNILTIKQRI